MLYIVGEEGKTNNERLLLVVCKFGMKKAVISVPNVVNNGLLQWALLHCSHNNRWRELISFSMKCLLVIRPEINTSIQLQNALKLFLSDKLLLKNLELPTEVTLTEFIRQVIQRKSIVISPFLQIWYFPAGIQISDMKCQQKNC